MDTSNLETENIYDKLKSKIYEKIAQALRDSFAAPILDVGCGDGELVIFLAFELKKEVFGVDISDADFGSAGREAELKKVLHLVKFVRTDSKNLDLFEDNYFGAIVSVYALHELGGTLAVLKELKRVLKPGGKLIVVDFIRGGEAERRWGERYYTSEELKFMLEYSGFNEIEESFLYEDVIFIHAQKFAGFFPPFSTRNV
ncbi:MAG: class I SAM-dependent methyltransferase [Methanophagales archaeon]|nr:class I SAM-dependent methyltransferase [Methanophagales archaeon]